MTESEISERLIDQRVRNRMMETLDTLAAGNDGVREAGAVEYFESYYDWVTYDQDVPLNSALTEAEKAALLEVRVVLDQACDATPRMVTNEELIASGWPERVRPVAERALKLFSDRGRFSEEIEESEPNTGGACS